ncbi:MAG: hypothetical protein LV481_14885 [Methylacidiphilales bacterium]|nr:hypothetical protein [Candidatus Methylacidiphilales bacterium]
MKTKLALMLLALAAVSLNLQAATSALPAPLPEFMDQQQLAKWNADQAATATATTANEPSTQFYTGKPYVADAGGYVFKYRTYNPEMSRWTSADPSGFPDGVNNKIYAPCPTDSLDSQGLSDSSITYIYGFVSSGGGSLSGEITTAAEQDPASSGSAIQGYMNTQFNITSATGGYLIQQVTLTSTANYNNGGGAVSLGPLDNQTFYEAYYVPGTASAADPWTTPTFGLNTNGSLTVDATATFFPIADFSGATGNNNPANWQNGSAIGADTGDSATFSAPAVWNNVSYSQSGPLGHYLTMNWGE